MAKHHRSRATIENGRSLGAAALRAGSGEPGAGASGSSGRSTAKGSGGRSDGRPAGAATRASGSGTSSRARSRAVEPRRRSLRERPGLLLAIAVGVVAVALGALTLLLMQRPAPAPTSQVGGVTQWQADPPGLESRLSAAGLPALKSEGEVVHTHQHLDLYVNGEHVPVPANIGIDEAAAIISPIHTHDDTGIIHVESPTVRDFTLGQFFRVWGVEISDSALGEYRADATHQLKMWVNGQPYSGNPADLKLEEHQEIVVAYGTADQMPANPPATYQWPQGV